MSGNEGSINRDARRIAAEFVLAEGRSDEAEMIARAAGDDFPEVRLARHALRSLHKRLTVLEEALRCYGDPEFWDDQANGAPLALYDRGEVARAALLGKDQFAGHRD